MAETRLHLLLLAVSLISLPVILLVFPVLTVIVWLAQRFQSPGPLFHVQTRAGMQNRQFTIYKFRTMRPDHEEARTSAYRLAEVGDPMAVHASNYHPLSAIRGPQRAHRIGHDQQEDRVGSGRANGSSARLGAM